MYLVRCIIMRHTSTSPFGDHTFYLEGRSKLEMSKNLARVYGNVLEGPLPPGLRRLTDKLELARNSLSPAIIAAV